MKNNSVNYSLRSLLLSLWGFISPRRKNQFLLLFFLMIATSITEIVSIGAVLPFLAILTAPDRLFELDFLKFLIDFFEFKTPNDLLLPLTFFFIMTVLLTGFLRVFYILVSSRLSFMTGHDLSLEMYKRTLYQSYEIHLSRNSSEIINGILLKASGVINGIIMPILTIISSFIMVSVIMIGLIIVDPFLALISFGGFSFLYALTIKFTRQRLLSNSKKIAEESSVVIKALQEGLGGIRDVLIGGSQETYCHAYQNADLPLRRAEAKNLFIGQSPRFFMESLGMILIALMAYFLSIDAKGLIWAIPLIGTFALAAQRLLPMLQQAYVAWSCIRGGQVSLKDTIQLLSQPIEDYEQKKKDLKKITFNNKILLNKISFKYKSRNHLVLKNVNLDISKGEILGIVGSTGSGKSTLVDIITGLLKPTHGSIVIDKIRLDKNNLRSWQSIISYVPQNIFLADASIAENIAFGIPRDLIDYDRVIEAAKVACLEKTVNMLKDKYDTAVGEKGLRFSGGQRQRIGIARAFYKQSQIIILDEATSAVDNKTEQMIMTSINNNSRDITLIIIAHRIATLKKCTRIIEVKNKSISKINSFDELAVNHS